MAKTQVKTHDIEDLTIIEDDIADSTYGSPATVGTTNSDGTSKKLVRVDHVHAHGDQHGGTQHSLAEPTSATSGGVPGFISAEDQEKLDNITPGAALNTVAVPSGRDSNVPGGGTLFLRVGGIVTSSAGFILSGGAATLTGLSITVDVSDGSRDYRLDLVSDPTGTPAIVGSLALSSGSRTAFTGALSVAITSGTELGYRLIRTSGAGASTFAMVSATGEFEF